MESLKVVYGEVTHYGLVAVSVSSFLRLFESKLGHGSDSLLCGGFRVRSLKVNLFAVDEIYSVSVDDTVTLTLNFKVVGNQVNRAAGNERVLGFGRCVAEATGVATRRVAASSVDISHGLRLAVALSLAAHIGLWTAKLTSSLAMVRWLLHMAGVVVIVGALSLHGVHLLWAHELVLVRVGLGPAPELLLLV